MFLYYISDRHQLGGTEQLLERVAAAARAGVDAIQLREKDLNARELVCLGREVVSTFRAHSPTTKVLINSRMDVALACGADGVHLRSTDLPASDARAVLMQAGMARPIIAVSCHSLPEVELAEGHGADFAVFGPVFQKGIAEPQGLVELQRVCRNRRLGNPAMPVLAIGGVNWLNAKECLSAGAAGVAGIRLFQEAAVEEKVAQLRQRAL